MTFGQISEPGRGGYKPPDELPCGCSVRRDYDGERTWSHCDEHCPKVATGQWEHCGGC